MSLRFVAALILASAALPASAQTYKWVDAKGQVNYSNTPPQSVAGVAQPVEERISVMGMDPAVRAAAERRFAAEEADWQARLQASAARQQYYYRPASNSLSPSRSYASTYYPGTTYGPVVYPTFFATAPSVAHRPRHEHRGGQHRHR